jgi:hypothetical protein
MDSFIAALPFAAGLLVGMLVCLEVGRRLGIRRLANDPEGAMAGLGAIEGAVFALYGLLFVLGLVCSLVAGFGMAGSKHRSWIHIGAFSAVTVVSVFVILDIEYPRTGLIQLEAYDQVLIDLRHEMK